MDIDLCCYTKYQDVDVKIFSYVSDDEFIKLCYYDKYINSLNRDVWIFKLLLIFPDIPIPKDSDVRLLYFAAKTSYLDLEKYAGANKYNELSEWLKIPINDVNLVLERQFYEPDYKPKELTHYLDNNVYPRRITIDKIPMLISSKQFLYKSLKISSNPSLTVEESIHEMTKITVRRSITKKNLILLSLLGKYGLYPNIAVAIKNGHTHITRRLLELGEIPDQKSINHATNNILIKTVKVLAEYGYFPDQKCLDNILEQQKFDIIDVLCQFNIFDIPKLIHAISKKYVKSKKYGEINNQEDLHNYVINGQYGVIEQYAKYNIFPLQSSINYATENNIVWVVRELAIYGQFPEQHSINIALEKNNTHSLSVLAKYNSCLINI
jgi:hypothetical protein